LSPHIPHRHRDDLRPSARLTVATIGAFCPRGSCRARLTGNAPGIVGRIRRAAFASRAALASVAAIASFAARRLRVDQPGKEWLFGGANDRDLTAAATRATGTPVSARASRTAGAAGTPSLPIGAGDPVPPVGAA
jgi:hypothetical protein